MKVGVVGCWGQMGRMLVAGAINDDRVEFVGGTEHPESALVGQDIAVLLGLDKKPIYIGSDPLSLFQDSDVIIDFTAPAATVNHAKLAAETRTALIIGTTGLSDEDQMYINNAALMAAIVQAGNMSMGINLLVGITEKAAKILGESWDVEVLEMHHRKKVDAPSGTALMLGEAAASGMGVKHSEKALFGRKGRAGPRPDGEIGYSVLRGGDVVGDHSIIFAGYGERIEFTHKASDRALFVKGALRAALWIGQKEPGLYSMRDVLNLD